MQALLLKKIIEAHGGASYWRGLEAIEAELSASGFLFTSKFRPALDRVRVRAYTDEPRLTFFDFPERGQNSEFFGDREVAVQGADGAVVARRSNPRAALGGWRRLFYWDHLDFVYFAGYATWNYLMTPFLFLRPGFAIEEVKPLPPGSPYFKKLRVTFPDDVPTHCREQIFYFDDDLLLRRLDYTAEVIGRWARAAHHCDDYKTFDGLKIPLRRRVSPVFLGRQVSSWPTLVSIDIHSARTVRREHFVQADNRSSARS
jgi:hypothetical protein